MLPHILNGTLREHYILLFSLAGSFAAVIGFAGAWIGAQFGARRAAGIAAERALAHGGLGVDRSLAALVQAVDSIALEVERLSEGQRFTARLMSERQGVMPSVKPDIPARVITPH